MAECLVTLSGLATNLEVPVSPLPTKFNNKKPLFLKLLLVLFCYLQWKAFLSDLLYFSGVRE